MGATAFSDVHKYISPFSNRRKKLVVQVTEMQYYAMLMNSPYYKPRILAILRQAYELSLL